MQRVHGLPLRRASCQRIVREIGSHNRICSYIALFTDTDVWQNHSTHPDKSSVSNLYEGVVVNKLCSRICDFRRHRPGVGRI